jgi:hypothetical protein
MRKGEKRPRKWSNAVPTGRQGEAGIRAQLASIARALKDRNLKHKDRLRYLDHSARLQNELRLVTQERLQRRVEELEASGTAEQFTK